MDYSSFQHLLFDWKLTHWQIARGEDGASGSGLLGLAEPRFHEGRGKGRCS